MTDNSYHFTNATMQVYAPSCAHLAHPKPRPWKINIPGKMVASRNGETFGTVTNIVITAGRSTRGRPSWAERQAHRRPWQ